MVCRNEQFPYLFWWLGRKQGTILQILLVFNHLMNVQQYHEADPWISEVTLIHRFRVHLLKIYLQCLHSFYLYIYVDIFIICIFTFSYNNLLSMPLWFSHIHLNRSPASSWLVNSVLWTAHARRTLKHIKKWSGAILLCLFRKSSPVIPNAPSCYKYKSTIQFNFCSIFGLHQLPKAISDFSLGSPATP